MFNSFTTSSFILTTKFWFAVLAYSLVLSLYTSHLITNTFAGVIFVWVGLYALWHISRGVIWKRRRISALKDLLPRMYVPLWVTLPLALFFTSIVVSAFANPPVADNAILLIRYVHFILPFFLVFCLRGVDIRILFVLLSIVVNIIAIYSLVQHLYGVDWIRPEGSKISIRFSAAADPNRVSYHAVGQFGHHTTFGIMMLCGFFFFAILAIADNAKLRWYWMMTAFSSILAVEFSLARSSWFAAVAGMTVVLPCSYPRFRNSLSLIIILLFFLCTSNVAISLFYQGGKFHPKVEEKINQARYSSPEKRNGYVSLIPAYRRISQTTVSRDRERFYLWQLAWLHIQKYPLFGSGMRNHYQTLVPFYTEMENALSRRVFSRDSRYNGIYRVKYGGVHNLYLQMGVNLGILGLFLYLVWISSTVLWILKIVLAYYTHPSPPIEYAVLLGALGGIIAISAAGFFQEVIFNKEPGYMLVVLTTLAWHCGSKLQSQSVASNGKPPAKKGRFSSYAIS